MSIARHHAEWLSLIEVSGPFLSLPVLLRVFPQGLEAHDPEHLRLLRLAHQEWEDDQQGPRPDPAIHRAWVRFVLGQTLALGDEVIAESQAISPTLRTTLGEHGAIIRPDLIVRNPGDGTPRLLIQVYPAGQDLERRLGDGAPSPATRMMELLHASGVRLGLATDGERWMLVDAPRGETTGFASWYATLWLEEQLTLRAFRGLLSARRFFAAPADETPEAMLAESAANQQEVTDQLGYQVRRAVEVLVQALDRADQDAGRNLLTGIQEETLYEAALAVMMRLVFLFSAEERGLLLLGDDLFDRNYAVSTLRAQLREAADQHGEEVLGLRYDAWSRLLAAFRAVHGGIDHERLPLPGYGGHLFDPDKYLFLEGRPPGSNWRDADARPVAVDNRTVLHLLEALQVLQVKVPGGGPAEARKVSFRALDIEQIGHVYEGLLDHTARRAAEPILGLAGTRDHEPEVALAALERLRAKGEKDLLAFLKEETGRSEPALKKALALEVEGQEAGRFRAACGNDEALWGRVRPFAGLVRADTFGHPVVILSGSVFVTEGTDRRSSGTHYTPRSLTEPIVEHALEPLVFVGPAEGKPREQWSLRLAAELLDLKVCDMACGSGAFLVQACRYLSDRLLEAWSEVERKARPGHQADLFRDRRTEPRPGLRITPYGLPSEGNLFDQFVSLDPIERESQARRIIAQRCLYGVDKNPLAVEMAKLSLWLLTMARDKPFTFLDHAIRCGDSLVGVDLEQLRAFSLDRQKVISLPNMLDMIPRILDANRLARSALARIPDNTPDLVAEKARRFANVEYQSRRLTYAADLLLAVSWRRTGAAERDGLLRGALGEVEHRIRDVDPAALVADARRRREEAGVPQPFHWPLEFPEVFVRREGAGFDAYVGNPPFMGGQKITGAIGTAYRDYLVKHLAGGQRGSADLCAYFFLRARQVLRNGGTFGLLATNTIAQGDTREVGLEQLVSGGCTITRAVPSRPWPGTANLEVAHVWGRKGPWAGPFVLDERPVPGITPFLTPPGTVAGKPHRLAANAGKSFIGS